MKITQMRHLIAAAERGSVHGAARHLGIAQPTLSRSLQDLEQELGVTLFERSRNGMLPTEIGKIVLRRARAMVAELDRTLAEVAHFKRDADGAVSIGMSTAAQIAILPRVLPPFRKRYPDVRFSIIEGLFPALEKDIRDGLIDIFVGAVISDARDDSLRVTPLFKNRRIIVARSGHPLSHARSLADLAGASWITTQVAADSEREVRAAFVEAGLPPPTIVGEVRSGMSIVTVVGSTDLLCPLPSPWSQIVVHIPTIQELGVTEITYSADICSVRRAYSPLSPPAQHMLDLIDRAGANYAKTTLSGETGNVIASVSRASTSAP